MRAVSIKRPVQRSMSVFSVCAALLFSTTAEAQQPPAEPAADAPPAAPAAGSAEPATAPAEPAPADAAEPSPAPSNVALWPLTGERVPDDELQALNAAVQAQLQSLAPGRTVSAEEIHATASRPDATELLACPEELRCMAGLGSLMGAGQILTGVARSDGSGRSLQLRLVDVASQRELGRVVGDLPRPERELTATVRELVARLVAPALHVGTLVINGVDKGVEIFVDNARQAAIDGGTLRLNLPVGKHSVEARRAGRPVLTEVVDVRFEEIMVVMAPPAQAAPAPVAQTAPAGTRATDSPGGIDGEGKKIVVDTPAPERTVRIPVWVGPLVMSLVVPPLLVGSVFLFDLLYIGPLVIMRPSTCQPVVVQSADGVPRPNPNVHPGNACGSLWRYGARGERETAPAVVGDIAVVAFSGLLAAAALGGGALLLGASFAPPLEDRDAPREGKPRTTRMTATPE